MKEKGGPGLKEGRWSQYPSVTASPWDSILDGIDRTVTPNDSDFYFHLSEITLEQNTNSEAALRPLYIFFEIYIFLQSWSIAFDAGTISFLTQEYSVSNFIEYHFIQRNIATYLKHISFVGFW
jgi:hypothetical protein